MIAWRLSAAKWRKATMISIEHDQHATQDMFSTQFGDGELGDSGDREAVTPASITDALASGHLNADQALWLHDHRVPWEISVERSNE
jgi:hypothetical protein